MLPILGGTGSSYNHVDGGTSQFDKGGEISSCPELAPTRVEGLVHQFFEEPSSLRQAVHQKGSQSRSLPAGAQEAQHQNSTLSLFQSERSPPGDFVPAEMEECLKWREVLGVLLF